MKKNTFFSLSQILFYLFFFVKNGTLYAQGSQELFTNTVIEKSKWKPEFIEKILKIERNVFHKRTYCVEVGNLAKVQKDGFLSFNIPMTGIKATFRATQVEAESEQDFLWIGKSEDKLYGQIYSIYKSVFVSICSGCRTGEKTTADTNLTDISTPLDVFPNPSTNIVNIQFTVLKTANVIVNVVGDNGISLKGLDFGVLELGNYKKAIEMSEFPAGNYHLNLYVGDEVRYKKIILTK